MTPSSSLPFTPPTLSNLTVPQSQSQSQFQSQSSTSRPKLRRPSTAPNLTNSSAPIRQITALSQHEALSLSPGPSFSHLVCPGAPRRPFLTLELELDDTPLSEGLLFDSPPSYNYQDDEDDEDEDGDGDAQISVYEFIRRSPCSPPYQPYDSQDELPFEFDFDLDLNEEQNQNESSVLTPMTLDNPDLGLQLDLGIQQHQHRHQLPHQEGRLSVLVGDRLEASKRMRREASAWWSTTPELSISPTETEPETGSPFFSSFATPPRGLSSYKPLPILPSSTPSSSSSSASSPKRPETVDDDMPWHDLPSPSPSRSNFTPPTMGKSTPHTAERKETPELFREAISLAAFLAENPNPPFITQSQSLSIPSGGRVRRASEGDCLVRQDQQRQRQQEQQTEKDRERGRNARVGGVISRARAALRRVREEIS